MCKILASAAIGGVFAVVFSLAAQAFPAPPYQPGSGERVETLIAQGCGPGMHRGPLGGCRRNAVVVAPRAPVVVAPRVCPRGSHRGPGGACRPN
jgi:hypothetical protein